MRLFYSIVAVLAGCLLSGSASAQPGPRCGHEAMYAADPAGWSVLRAAAQSRGRGAAHLPTTEVSKTTAVPAIPVVFHVVLTPYQYARIGGAAGVEARVDSQLAVLNRDFNGANPDSSGIPAVFKPRYANVGLRFGRAIVGPGGSATTGVEVRVLAPGEDSLFELLNFCADVKTASRGFASWDWTRYLNVWVCDIYNTSAGEILGVATPTSTSGFSAPDGHIFGSADFGVVLNYGAIGVRRSPGEYFISSIDRGRTATHEIGHYFELDHIWGSGATCADDDGIADTPPQLDQNFGCPAFPAPSCAAAGADGDMFMNYMDYVDDRCMFMFTAGQATRMRQEYTGSGILAGLTEHPELVSVRGVDAAAASTNLSLWPNPATGAVWLSWAPAAGLQGVDVVDVRGAVVMHADAPAGGASNLTLDLSAQPAGVYAVQCRFRNGVTTRKVVLW